MAWTELVITCSSCGLRTSFLMPLREDQTFTCLYCGKSLPVAVRPVGGFVYVLSNICMPGLVKIGFTERSVEERAAELSAGTGVPTPYVVEAYFSAKDAMEDEKRVHEAFWDYRVNRNREFFKVDVLTALRRIREVLGREPSFRRERLALQRPTSIEEALTNQDNPELSKMFHYVHEQGEVYETELKRHFRFKYDESIKTLMWLGHIECVEYRSLSGRTKSIIRWVAQKDKG